MNVSRADSARALVAAVILGFLAFGLLVQYAPDTVAFSPNNYGWNGLQGVASAYSVNFTTSLSSVPPKGVLVVSQPSINFTDSEAAAVRSFLLRGGTLLVADKSGIGDSLLLKVGSAVTIQSRFSISDRTYNWKSKSVPTALVVPSAKPQFPFLANVTGIALNQPSPLQVSGTRASDLAITSQFSVSDSPSGGTGAHGPFVVMAAQKVGNGTLVVVGDSQFLLNSEWTIADNRVLIGNLFGKTNVFVDASHWGAASVAQLKSEFGQFYAYLSMSPLKYVAALFVVGVALALVPSRKPAARSTPFNRETEGVAQ